MRKENRPNINNAITTEAPSDSARKVIKKASLGHLFISLGLPLFIVLLAIVFAIIEPRFASTDNLKNVARQMASDLAIMASAQIFAILIGGIDVSIGSIVGGSSVITAYALQNMGLAGMVAGVLFGILIGLLNGVIIARFQVAPFVATLGMLTAVRGWALTFTGGEPIFRDIPRSFMFLGIGYVGPVPIPVILAVVVLVAVSLVLKYTRLGRYIYAIGGNEEASRLSGINVTRYKIFAYMICGGLAGLTGVVLSSQINSGAPNLGELMELDAIAAVVIGGVALGGGRGNMIGVVMGVILLGILRNGLNLANVSPYTQLMVIGVVVILGVIVDKLRYRGEGR